MGTNDVLIHTCKVVRFLPLFSQPLDKMQYIIVKEMQTLKASINILTPSPIPSEWITECMIFHYLNLCPP